MKESGYSGGERRSQGFLNFPVTFIERDKGVQRIFLVFKKSLIKRFQTKKIKIGYIERPKR